VASAAVVGVVEVALGEPILKVATHGLLIVGLGFAGARSTRRAGGVGGPDRLGLALWASIPALALVVQLAHLATSRDWDHMFVSGMFALVLGIVLVDRLPEALDATLVRLRDRRVVRLSTAQLQGLRGEVERRARAYGRVGALVTGLAVAGGWTGFLLTAADSNLRHRLWAVVLETLAAALAGARIGRLVACSTFWPLVGREGGRLSVRIHHPDGVGGTSPYGRYCLHLSFIAGIPALFLTAWWFAIPLWSEYASWRMAYVTTLPLAIALEVAAFVGPMLAMHADLRHEKRRLLRQADRTSIAIDRLATTLVSPDLSGPDRTAIGDRLAVLGDLHGKLESARTWPVNTTVRVRFTLGNLLALVPLVSYLLGDEPLWRTITDVLGSFVR
jgi:hypothetical protein